MPQKKASNDEKIVNAPSREPVTFYNPWYSNLMPKQNKFMSK